MQGSLLSCIMTALLLHPHERQEFLDSTDLILTIPENHHALVIAVITVVSTQQTGTISDQYFKWQIQHLKNGTIILDYTKRKDKKGFKE